MTQQASPTARQLARRIEQLSPWFHNLHLPHGLQTMPDHWAGDFPRFKWDQVAPHLPRSLRGMTALDIGCNAGFYSFELARRGADVTGIDFDDHYLKQARWARGVLDLGDRVRFRKMQIYDLARSRKTFDIVVFMGVMYHLRYPLLGLDIAASRARRLLIVQTMTMPGDEVRDAPVDFGFQDRQLMCEPGWPKMAFIEHRMSNDPTNWWAANASCVEAMIRSTGMQVVARPGEEIYVCRPDPKMGFRREAAFKEMASAAVSRRRR